MDNPRYPLELFQRVVTVSLETMKIVNALPKLNIDGNGSFHGGVSNAEKLIQCCLQILSS